MGNSSSENKKRMPPAPGPGQTWRVVNRRSDDQLPPPGSGKEIAVVLNKIAETLTPDDIPAIALHRHSVLMHSYQAN